MKFFKVAIFEDGALMTISVMTDDRLSAMIQSMVVEEFYGDIPVILGEVFEEDYEEYRKYEQAGFGSSLASSLDIERAVYLYEIGQKC